MKKKVNIHIYPSPFKNESRILKETKTIIDSGIADEIIILGSYSKGFQRNEMIDLHRKVHRVKTIFDILPKNLITDLFRFFSFQLVILSKYFFKKVDFINCHSLSVLPVGVLLKSFKKSKLIYDAHELETERAGLKGAKQKMSKYLERALFPFVDSTIVVSNSINEWYQKEYNSNRVYTVRNVPDLRFSEVPANNKLLKEKFGVRPDEILYIYQGLFGRGRAIEILLNVFCESNTNAHIVFMGYGLYEEKIKTYAKNNVNIHFQEAVPPDEIIKYSSSADVGLCLIENIGLSYYYCLPNKVFEYTLAKIPVIVSDFPDLSEFIDTLNCGWKIEPVEDRLKKLVSMISYDEIKKTSFQMKGIESKIGWQFEELELKKAYTN